MRAFLLALAVILAPLSMLAQDATNDIVFEAENTTLLELDYQIILKGNVKLSNDLLKLHADEVVVQFEEPAEEGGESQFLGATATGNVWARSEENNIEITSDSAEYEENLQRAVFKGNAKVKQNNSVVNANEVRMNLETGIYELVGGVKGKIRGSF